MAGELSPDRLFYWDGARWVSALSPDGSWRWDGSAWRPAVAASSKPSGTWLSSRWPWLIATGVVVALLVVGVGGYYGMTALTRASERFFTGPACTSPLAQPGVALARGESLCGGTLGDERLLADCTMSDGTPAGIVVWRKSYAPAGEWVQSTVAGGPDGCSLVAQAKTDVSFSSSDEEPVSTTVVADFKTDRTLNEFGLELACVEGGGCIDITMLGGGLYRLDEYHPGRGWANLTKGYLGPGASPRTDRANRLILRMTQQQVEVLLNGVQVTRATASPDQIPGDAAFYLDDRYGATAESAWLQRLYVFDSM